MYLVFHPDNGNREDCSVYYSNCTYASSEDEAVSKVATFLEDDPENYEALEIEIIE